jgi:hypothetical protein
MLCRNHFAEPNWHVLAVFLNAVPEPLNVRAGDRLAVGPVRVYPGTGCRSGSRQQVNRLAAGAVTGNRSWPVTISLILPPFSFCARVRAGSARAGRSVWGDEKRELRRASAWCGLSVLYLVLLRLWGEL